MLLENENCCIRIEIDRTYTVNSADNRHYDVTLNPCNYKHSDRTSTHSIHVDLFSKEYRIALIGPETYISDCDCAVLENDTLTVLQDYSVTQINVTDGSVIRHVETDCFGCNYGIYRVDRGYVIYGEIVITMLDFDLVKKWSFSAEDIFASVTGKVPFELTDGMIHLYDFEDNYYEIDLDGNLIRHIPAK